jgi:hypothetical protein
MPAADFVKEIAAKDIKKVEARLKTEKAAQTYNDPSHKGSFCSLLHKAIEAASPQIVDALLKAGADVNAVDHEGQTVLHWLSRSGDTASVQMLGACPYQHVVTMPCLPAACSTWASLGRPAARP